jgi:hypothetical protein
VKLFKFVGWFDEAGNKLSGSPTIDLTVDRDSLVYAVYEETQQMPYGYLECHSYVNTSEVSIKATVTDVGELTTPFKIKLIIGRYTVTATYNGVTQEKTADVEEGKTTLVEFYFPAPPPPPPTPVPASILFVLWLSCIFPALTAIEPSKIIESIRKRAK